MQNCPDCNSQQTVKNGHIHNGKPRFRCKDCHRQFVVYPTQKRISSQTKEIIDKLLLEKISLHGIVRVTGVSLSWLQDYVNKKYQRIEKKAKVCPKEKRRLTIECDEMWSFVQNKKNKQWIWLAIDRETKEIVGLFVGSRSEAGARGLWDSLPPVYRQCAVCYTDFWQSYNTIFPSTRHQAVGKETGGTNQIEGFNSKLRQRISRLVRKTLSFSKKLANHIGAIWDFIHHYNLSLHV